MKKLMRKTAAALFLLLALTLTAGPANLAAASVVATGNCGAAGNESSVVWTLDSDGVLSVAGSGPMAGGTIGYRTSSGDIRDSVLSVVVGQGVSGIGNAAFTGYANLTSVTIADTVEAIGFDAFRQCVSLESITIPASVRRLGNSLGGDVFYGDTSLKEVVFLGSPEEIHVKNTGEWDYSEELTIVSRRGSNAKKYADQYGIPWRELPGQTDPDPDEDEDESESENPRSPAAPAAPAAPALTAGSELYPGLSLRDYAEIPVSVLYSGDGYTLTETDLGHLRDALATVPGTGAPMVVDLNIEPLDGGYFLLTIWWDYTYFDIMRGVPVTPDGFVDLEKVTGIIGTFYNRTFSIMDGDLNLLAPIDVYKSCVMAGNLCVVTDYENGAYNDRDEAPRAIIDRSGKIVKPFGEYRGVFPVGDTGFYHIMRADEDENWFHGLMTETGEVIVPAKYRSVSAGNTGWYVPADDQDVLMSFQGDTDLYQDYDHYYFDKTTRALFKEPEFPEGWSNISDAFTEGLIPLYRWEQSVIRGAYADKNGDIVLTLEPGHRAYNFFSGTNLARFSSDRSGSEKYGLIDRSGRIVLPAEYDGISEIQTYYSERGLAEPRGIFVSKDGKGGFCDMSGKVVIPPIYDEVGVVCWSYVEYETASTMGGSIAFGLGDGGVVDDVIAVRNGKGPQAQYALYNIDGTVIAGIGQYDSISGYSDGVAVVVNANGDKIFLDTHGKELFRFESGSGRFGSYFSEGLLSAEVSGRRVWLDKTGGMASGLSEIPAGAGFGDGIALVGSGDGSELTAFMDKNGKTLSPFVYIGGNGHVTMTSGMAACRKWDETTKTFRPVLITKYAASGAGPTILIDGKQIPFDPYRISGLNRVETSVAISRQGWTSAETVILAPGGQNNLIDALAVAPLAGQEKAPILLSTGGLDPAVVAEIQRLGAKKIYAVGAISQDVINALQAALPGLTIETLRGANRFETASLINARVSAPKGTFIVGYNAVADAVSAASFAAANGYAIQIAAPDGWLARPLPEFSDLPVYILGGPTLVQDVPGATRLYGATRYETNKAVRDALAFDYTNIYTADGNTLVDALTGSALAAQSKAAIVLLPGNDPTGADFSKITQETKVYAFGAAK